VSDGLIGVPVGVQARIDKRDERLTRSQRIPEGGVMLQKMASEGQPTKLVCNHEVDLARQPRNATIGGVPASEEDETGMRQQVRE
jgi:hypothetical protein